MFTYFKLKIYIFLGVLVSIPVLVFGIYHYMTASKAMQGNLNINKIELVEKFYSYNVYSDFYFRASRFDSDGKVVARYSEVIPVKTSIGFNPQESDVILRSNISDPMILIENNPRDLNVIDPLKRFATVFSEIVATQDQFYFDRAHAQFMKNYFSLYGESADFVKPNVSEFYDGLIELPVRNLKLEPFSLDLINSNLKEIKIAPTDKWSPNLIEYHFGESDRIYLQYVGRYQGKVLDVIERDMGKNSIVVNTVKFHKNELSSLNFVIESRTTGSTDNNITAYLIDNNGYLYMLRYNAFNERSFNFYLPDFLKLAFSLYFDNLQGFDNWFANEQEQFIRNHATYVSNMKRVQILEGQLKDSSLIEHFNLSRHSHQILEYVPAQQTRRFFVFPSQPDQNLVRFDHAFNHFYQIYNRYPGKNEFAQEILDRELLVEAMSKRFRDPKVDSGIFGIGRATLGIKDVCDSLVCVRNLRDNDWRLDVDE